MNRVHRRPIDARPATESQADEAWQFAQGLLGKPIVISRASSDDRANRELLEWLATFSTKHQHILAGLRSAEEAAREANELREWSAGISTVHEAGWDAAQHPRLGGPPNAGWWATTGGSSSAHSSGGMLNVPAERVRTKIQLASGKHWNGDRVLSLMTAIAPDLIPFVKKHVTLANASSDEKGATTVVRSGEAGPEVKDISNVPTNDLGTLTVHIHIPDDWNDLQVAQYLLNQIADHADVHRLAANSAVDNPKLFEALRDQHFRRGLTNAAALAQGYYAALAGLAPGGGAAVAAWDIQRGDYLGAALGAAFMLPLGKIAKGVVESGGTVAIRAGDKLIATLPVDVIKRVQKMAPDQQALLQKRLLAAKTQKEAAGIVEDFLGTAFDRHHPLPKFLGGDTKQLLATIPKSMHNEFHAELRKQLRAAGLDMPIGTIRGSAEKWAERFEKNSGSQAKAFDAVLKASGIIDERHGTDITSTVVKNIAGKNFTPFQ